MNYINIIFILFACIGGIFLGLAVYNDAKARNIRMAFLWGIITGIPVLFNIILAIVYLVIRSSNKNAIKCPRCFAQIFNGFSACPGCLLPITRIPSLNPAEFMKHCKRAKRFLIASIILIVASYLYFLVFILIPLLTHFQCLI